MEDEEHTEDHAEEGHVFVFDRRKEDGRSAKISLGGLFSFSSFKEKVVEALDLPEKEEFVVVSTSRMKISDDKSYEDLVETGDTLYVLNFVDQDLVAPVQEHIEFLPHYDTLVKSGMYEYYASAGQSPLPFAFAELIDNALAATADNAGPREIKLILDFDSSSNENAVCVSDNGSGMTSKDLNNWAVYRLSKFNRQLKTGKTSPLKPHKYEIPHSLNSDISYFGVGGKQAIFFIGNATKVITKTKESSDIHEMSLSKTDFERKEKLKEPIYSGYITNRRVGDATHIAPDDKLLRELVEREPKQFSFTNVVVTGIETSKVKFLKQNFKCLCKQLAHIYHYYLHGPMGRLTKKKAGVRVESPFKHIEIQVILREKGTILHHVSLRDVEDDLESLFLNSTANIFEFNAHVQGTGKVEGVLRYHPFLYDRETFPASQNDDFRNGDQNAFESEDDPKEDGRGPRGDKPIFECFWNGRLIPYTTIDHMDWCAPPKKKSLIPSECYYRISGSLFTNDSFQVSTNKLTFMDLEGRLRERSTIFTKLVMGQEQRMNIGRAFTEWVKNCHETCDKQIKFFGFSGKVKRADHSNKRNQMPCSAYKGVEWDGKVFKMGQLVRTARTVPIVVGKVQRFLLNGDYEGDEVFATGGYMEIVQVPESLYGDIKVLPLAKLDRTPSIGLLREFVQNEELKLPATLTVEWPEGGEVNHNGKIPAGFVVGPLKVDILSGKGESINKIPGDRMKKLLVELKLIWKSEKDGEKTIAQQTSQHGGRSCPYFFNRMENIKDVGSYVLQLRSFVSETNLSTQLKSLPALGIDFTVTEAPADKFTVGMLETPLRIGLPFQIPLSLQDKYGNVVKPTLDYGEPILTAGGMDFTSSGTCVRGTLLVVRDVIAMGSIQSTGGKDFNLKISFSGLKETSQSIRIRLLPGLPSKIEASEDQILLENGKGFKLTVSIKDKAGNLTSQPRLNVLCKLYGIPGLPSLTCDCSATGVGAVSSPPIKVKQLKESQKIAVKIDLQHHKDVPTIYREILVHPSSKASKIEVYYLPTGKQKKIKIQNNQEIRCRAGETIKDISFVIFDEGGRELTVDSTMASKIKVNWVGKISKEDIKKGKLPDVKAPASVDEVKFCQVLYTSGDDNVELVFNLKSEHSTPTTLKSSCSNVKFKLNEKLASDIRMTLHDDYGNFIKMDNKDLKDLTISGEGLKESVVTTGVLQGSIVIRDVEFEAGLPGPREVCAKWKDIVCYQRLEMLSGIASDIVLVDFDNTEPVEILNGNPFPKQLKIQLIDAAGNLAKEKNVRCMLARDPGIKLNPPPPQTRTDDNGQATFNSFSINASRGLYQLIPKAMLSCGSKEGPVVLVSVEPDRNKPVQLIVKFDDTASLTAGGRLPNIEAYVLAEDENPISIVKAEDLILKVWSASSGKTSDPPSNASTYKASLGGLNNPEHHFFFRDILCPERAGQYFMQARYVNKNVVKISSKRFTINVNPSTPVKLVPLSIPATPTVSNNSRTASRQLVKNLKFQLKDKYGNTTGTDMNGVMKVNVEAQGVSQVPSLQNGQTSAVFQFQQGSSTIENLMVQANTKGVDGREYLLSFEAQPVGSQPLKIEPFKLSFLFYDDVKKQSEMSELTRERDRLTESISTYKSLFDATSQLLNEVKAAVQEAFAQEKSVRNELIVHSFKNVASLSTKEKVVAAHAYLKKVRQDMESGPRRKCRLALGPRDKEVVGKVGHLAEVREDDVARVLSWHLAADMDCVITTTTQQAKQVYSETNGRQQVLPLDSVFKKGLPDWKKPLPHVRFPAIKTPGPAIYARDLLIFPNHQEHCKTVFGMLLGDTILTDTLDTANKYRKEVVKFTFCPTILTRTGDRIRSNGKFGGLQNKAPPIEKMNGVVFGSPLPQNHQNICRQLDLLSSLEEAVSRCNEANQELQAQLNYCRSEKMQNDYLECLDAEKQLDKIEYQLGLTPRRRRLPPTLSDFLKISEHSQVNGDQRLTSKRVSTPGNDNEGPSPRKKGRPSLEPLQSSRRKSGSQRKR